MTTLYTTLSSTSTSPAIIVPSTSSTPELTISYQRLHRDIFTFQRKLAALGISPSHAVSIALPNSYPFIVAFLAASWQRAIAAPLNPAYKQSEFEFYIDDLSSALVLVPQGQSEGPAVRAAKKYGAAVAECWFDNEKGEVVLEVKDKGKLEGKGEVKLETPQAEDTALVLHTSGTTGRPKAVPLSHRNLTRTMKNVRDTYNLSKDDRTMLVMPLFHVHGLLAGFLAPPRLRRLRHRPRRLLRLNLLAPVRPIQSQLVHSGSHHPSDPPQKQLRLAEPDAEDKVHKELFEPAESESLP